MYKVESKNTKETINVRALFIEVKFINGIPSNINEVCREIRDVFNFMIQQRSGVFLQANTFVYFPKTGIASGYIIYNTFFSYKESSLAQILKQQSILYNFEYSIYTLNQRHMGEQLINLLKTDFEHVNLPK